jgi:hypothetical protein
MKVHIEERVLEPAFAASIEYSMWLICYYAKRKYLVLNTEENVKYANLFLGLASRSKITKPALMDVGSVNAPFLVTALKSVFLDLILTLNLVPVGRPRVGRYVFTIHC